jgi:hypothetical protein
MLPDETPEEARQIDEVLELLARLATCPIRKDTHEPSS